MIYPIYIALRSLPTVAKNPVAYLLCLSPSCCLQSRLPQNVVDEVEGAIKDVKSAQEGEDLALLKEKISTLSNAGMKIGESLNQQSGGSSSSSSGSGDGSSGTSQ